MAFTDPVPRLRGVCDGALPEGRLRLLAGRNNTRKKRIRQRPRANGGQVPRARDRSTAGRTAMHGEDRRNQGRRLRALEMIEERALGGRLAGTLYLIGAITAVAMLAVPGVDHRYP